ncbi:peptidoglycan DD-metalloendopeptidase family protein [Shewanella psychropiezotolerans]|uniref:Peptidoglycan DD-metalloendopeptidase family protein n=1 Tax=Shewanella psychropiezotolerans TaxID=2593655 RepID=A0ABX5WVJ6_9GAMM|nr:MULTISPECIES: peptidoglycan DD-metalloendopeptidase family protein [Shewanella]MPY22580.1 peptidoglycan DD-metalloendopeptidase family protein [Shewanella sp. YLB-07]QDO83114.1 peptidoglycan DD-metalloendopeptidase family protein [Shewanella psychropiezotolerans]
MNCKNLLLLALCICFVGCSFQSDRPAPVVNVTTPVMATYNKGSLKSDSYLVKRGDTLYSIAWASNNDFIDLAKKNKLKKPYVIYPGQKLNLSLTSTVTNSQTTKTVPNNPPKVVSTKTKTNKKQTHTPVVTTSKQPEVAKKKPLDPVKESAYSVTTSQQDINKSVHRPTTQLPTKVSKWLWPVRGKLIGRFSANEQGNKGIKIAGNRGEIIKSAADGRVVYAGSALRGYGNLVIIKHSDNFLSAYAHADKILVKEKQFVSMGQTLATMGNTGTDRVMLHFEIRYHGKSVNPLKYLPKQ